jgi:hypothetical protein
MPPRRDEAKIVSFFTESIVFFVASEAIGSTPAECYKKGAGGGSAGVGK